MNIQNQYIYKAYVESVYDGDTITCTIDCGFGIHCRKQKIRLYGINTPEIRGTEKKEGIKVRDILKQKILGKQIVLKTIKDKKGKYGRYLGIIFLDNVNINEWLIDNHFAEHYKY